MDLDFQKKLDKIRIEKAKLDPLRPQFCKTKTDWEKLDRWWELVQEENKIENEIWQIEKHIEENTLSTPLSEYEAIEEQTKDDNNV
jgi:hypothetical protein